MVGRRNLDRADTPRDVEARPLLAWVTYLRLDDCGAGMSPPSASQVDKANRIFEQLGLNKVLFDRGSAAVPARESDDLCTRARVARRELPFKQARKPPLVSGHDELPTEPEMPAQISKPEHIHVVHRLHWVIQQKER